MDEQFEKLNRTDKLAREILLLSRNTLLVNLRFLDAALSRLTPVPWLCLCTDGRALGYDPRALLLSYKAERAEPVRSYLHVVLHCVFRHTFVHGLVDHLRWDLACDIAVENVINELGIRAAETNRARLQVGTVSKLKTELKQLTAEKIYRYYCDSGLSDESILQLRELFRADDHEIWYLPPEQQTLSGSGNGDDSSNGDGDNNPSGGGVPIGSEADWKDVSERMQMDMETFSKKQGDKAGSMLQNLAEINREKYDYTAFLKKFAVRGEVMKINDDEFDYIFYTYGLKLYDKMPLIEPLEYKEVKRIREFVIAIDTSGSTSGELVQKFVQKTYNILKSTESFFSKINLHIIQCDADIQEHVKITSQEEFDEYLKTMQIRGLGGTDFRPVFGLVDELVKAHEFQNLKGLIYFTDGYGSFPAKKPDYETAFVFIDDEFNNPDVPPWAIKLVLQKNEI